MNKIEAEIYIEKNLLLELAHLKAYKLILINYRLKKKIFLIFNFI